MTPASHDAELSGLIEGAVACSLSRTSETRSLRRGLGDHLWTRLETHL